MEKFHGLGGALFKVLPSSHEDYSFDSDSFFNRNSVR